MRSRTARPRRAGIPLEPVGDGGPRWMVAPTLGRDRGQVPVFRAESPGPERALRPVLPGRSGRSHVRSLLIGVAVGDVAPSRVIDQDVGLGHVSAVDHIPVVVAGAVGAASGLVE